MRRTVAVAGVVVVTLALGCDSPDDSTASTETTERTMLPSTTTTTSTTGAVISAATSPALTDVLDGFIGSIERGDADQAFGFVAVDASWGFDGIELQLGAPLPAEWAWLPTALGLSDTASSSDVAHVLVSTMVALRTTPELTNCDLTATTASCEYRAENLFSRAGATTDFGTLTVEVVDGLITRFQLELAESSQRDDGADDFKRWSMIHDPDVARERPFLAYAELVAELADAWEAAGRPVVASPLGAETNPIEVAQAFFTARNGGEWETTVALMGGEALDDPFGSRDEFDAARLLRRDITLLDCEVTLETATGERVACLVSVNDMIAETAGVTPTNPNRTSLTVSAGRLTALPQFIPSSFVAESAIEEWALAEMPDRYAVACPQGIAGQSPIEGLACARFIVEHIDGWRAAVQALDLGP